MLLNDKQITLLAMKGMIEPFTAGQVRTVTKNGQEERVISYGLSSAGYDIRLGRSFKVFKPVWEGLAVVDPKMTQGSLFDEFEDVDYCIIPPNSYVLGYSVEHFRVPRDVQVLVVGKSTYARCFRGDTRVALVDGTSPTLEEMAHRAESGESFWGYSVNEEGRIAVAQLESPRYVGRDSLVEVLLDNEKSIFCTPDHLFMLRNGSWMQADQLRPNTSLMPLYRTTGRGYEMVYQLENGRLYPTHRLSDEWNIRNGAYVAQEDTHRHHVDLNKRNNNPWNIVRMDAAEHTRMHNSINYGDGFDAIRHGAAVRRAIQQLSQDPVWAANFSRIQSERAAKFWNEEQYLETRAKLINQRCNPSDATRQAHRDATLHRFEDANERVRLSEAQRAAWANSNIERRVRQAEIARGINIRQEITADVVHDALTQTGSIRGAARMLNCDRAVFRRFPETMQAFREQVAIRNHKVLSVRQIQGSHDVFCLTVPEAGNFALESGVFVHNCGLIVNVTPGEPGWEGHWTIEISNASPLPAIVYADEGIAQCLFFTIDEPEVSYADRSGKYQGQGAEVVTARV